MRDGGWRTAAFTLVELAVVLAILAIFAALLLPLLSAACARERRTICLANLSQINQGVIMYATDNQDILFPLVKKPQASRGEVFNFHEWTAYVPLVGPYVGWKRDPSPQNKVFACPADTFRDEVDSNRTAYWVNQSLHASSNVNYSSYFFNAANGVIQGPVREKFPDMLPGVLGLRLSSIRKPVRTLLVGEEPAWLPYSWHSPCRPRQFNDAPNLLGFADGHVSYVKVYSGQPGRRGSMAFDPPPGYDYQWSAN